ncbi:MAG: thioredoxin family protein [Kofleriaceae bacterium]
MKGLLLAAALLLVGCKDKGTTSGACKGAKQEGPLAWIADDYDGALACAKQKNVPLVVDLWAPWCHTCVSMQSTVLHDKAMAPMAERFVFAAIDTDREVNAKAVKKLPLSAWPTFYVVAPEDGSVLARFAGGASVAQFTAFLESGAAARAAVDGAAKHLLAAERALAAKDLATAENELTAALAAAPATWVRRPDAFVSLIHTKRKRDDIAGCFELGQASLDETGNAASATDFAGIALDCASDRFGVEPEKVPIFRERVIARLQKLLADTSAPLSYDDRSDAMSYLRGVLATVGRKPESISVAEQQRIMLEEAIAKAPNATAASAFNYQLADVFITLGRPIEAVPALEKSAKALPGEYDPPARLGWVYLEAGRLDEAAKWTDTALKLVYGPRKARVLAQRANIEKKRGDVATEKKYRAEIVALWTNMPPDMANPDALAKAQADLAVLDTPSAPPPPPAPQ